MKNIFFNAHHSPMGAFSSFTLGYKGNKGGLGLELGKPADQNIYIGLESNDGDYYEALPFFVGSVDEAARYDVENAISEGTGHDENVTGQESDGESPRPILIPFNDDEISRDFKLNTDCWKAKDIEFTVYTNAQSVPDPATASDDELKKAIIPAVYVTLTINNEKGSKDRRGFLGFSGNDIYSAMRHIELGDRGNIKEISGQENIIESNSAKNIKGIGQGRHLAIASADKGIVSALGFTLENILTETMEENYSFALGNTGAILFDVKKGEKKTFTFVLAFHRDGYATTGMDTKYYYTKYFKNIEEVIAYGLTNAEDMINSAKEGNRLLDKEHLSEDQKFMMAHAIRSYYGSTELLIRDGQPLWVVNEGEYRMMNTFDLTVDQLFYEIKMNPWTVKNELELFIERYSYYDKVRFPGEEKEYPGGISFTHDMGVGNVFSREGHSSYEKYGLDGCFSHMTHEQLVNWILCAAVYVEQSGDKEWLNKRYDVVKDCFYSMLNRDNPNRSERNGLMSLDSTRTMGGAEITTYDSLDQSLGQARNNIYMAVKCWASYVALEKIFKDQGDDKLRSLAKEQSVKCANTLVDHMTKDGYIPAVIDENNDSKIIPAIEGLVFPYFTGNDGALSLDGEYKELIKVLKKHLETVLVKGVCLFEDGGWKLSSTSNNSWLSKIYLSQFVARQILGMPQDVTMDRADGAHVHWLLHEEESYHCWSDQMINGIAAGSKYYPRGVTSILWLDEV